MNKHSLGPWTVADGTTIYAAHGGKIARAVGDDSYEQRCADARLIAAAPAMLAALLAVVRLAAPGSPTAMWVEVDAAIVAALKGK